MCAEPNDAAAGAVAVADGPAGDGRPDEPAELPVAGAARSAGDEGEGDAERPTAEAQLEEAKAERDEAKREVAVLTDRMLRVQAEFANARKRLEQEKLDASRYAAFDTIQSLLPVIDDIEKAVATGDAGAEDFRTGLKQIHKKMLDIFERAGLKSVEHDTFDPRLHEALASQPAAEGQSDQQILEVWRKGYLFKERLMRASWVKVAVQQ